MFKGFKVKRAQLAGRQQAEQAAAHNADLAGQYYELWQEALQANKEFAAQAAQRAAEYQAEHCGVTFH